MNRLVGLLGLLAFLMGGARPGRAQATIDQSSRVKEHQRLGYELFRNERYASSNHQYDLALRDKSIEQNFSLQADIYASIGTNYYNQGEFQKALNACRKGLELARKGVAGDTIFFKLHLGKSVAFMSWGKYDSSLISFQRNEKILQAKPHLEAQIASYVATHYNGGGVLFDALGDGQQSKTYLEKALIIARKFRLTDYVSVFLNNIAAQYSLVGNYEKAIELCQESLKYTVTPTQRCARYLNLGRYNLQIKQYGQALENYQKAEKLYGQVLAEGSTTREPMLEFNLPFGLGRYYFEVNRLDLADEYLFEALAATHRQYGTTKHPDRAKVYIWQGQVREARREWANAAFLYQQAINELRTGPALAINENPVLTLKGEVISENVLFEALQRKAHVLSRQYDRSKQLVDLRFSLETYRVAIHLADRIRRGYETSETKLFFLNQVYPTYEQALAVTFQLYEATRQASYREIAFQIMEKSKAATLSDALRDAQVKPTVLPAEYLTRERSLKKTLTDLRNTLITAQTPEQRLSIENQINEQEVVLGNLLQQFERISPQYYQFKYRTETVELSRIQQEVTDEQTALISYFMGRGDLYTFVVTREGTEFIRQRITPVLRKYIASLRRELYASPGLDIYRGNTAAQQCYRYLIQPIEKRLVGKSQLILVRDNDLHFIPFEALESGQRKNDYLVKHFAIRYAYSGTLLQKTHANHPRRERYSVMSMAPYSDISQQANRFRDKTLGALPASRQEVISIGGQAYLDHKATKAHFLEAAQHYRIIHLATHARADQDNPARSYIAFYPNQEDHKLFTNELYNLSLEHTRLVVLSACETGAGRVERSEGTLSLSRAFMYAGCPSIVTTLWNAHDESSAYIAKRLHHYLRKGTSTDVALQQAKLDYFESDQSKAYDHPYYWAHFVLIGDNTPIYTPAPWGHFMTWLGGGLLVGLVLLAGLRYALYVMPKKGHH
jgi:CHAT domain-containing protein